MKKRIEKIRNAYFVWFQCSELQAKFKLFLMPVENARLLRLR